MCCQVLVSVAKYCCYAGGLGRAEKATASPKYARQGRGMPDEAWFTAIPSAVARLKLHPRSQSRLLTPVPVVLDPICP